MDQSVLNRILLIIEIAAGINTLIGAGVMLFVKWSNQKTRADTAEIKIGIQKDNTTLREDILDRLDKKLDEYVRLQRFKDYQESHAKEHLDIHQEITRFRDWKHETAEPLLRKHDTLLTLKDKD